MRFATVRTFTFNTCTYLHQYILRIRACARRRKAHGRRGESGVIEPPYLHTGYIAHTKLVHYKKSLRTLVSFIGDVESVGSGRSGKEAAALAHPGRPRRRRGARSVAVALLDGRHHAVGQRRQAPGHARHAQPHRLAHLRHSGWQGLARARARVRRRTHLVQVRRRHGEALRRPLLRRAALATEVLRRRDTGAARKAR